MKNNMKKIILSICFITVILSITLLCGCTLINNIMIDAPRGLYFDEETNTIFWNKVNGAEYYEICISQEGKSDIIKTTNANNFYLGSIAVGDITIKVRSVKGDRKSKYSDSLNISYTCPLDVNAESLKAEFSDGKLTISWDSIPEADGYMLSYKYNSITTNNQLTTNSFVIADYIQTKVCTITVYALGSGNYMNGKPASCTFYGIPDYENITADVFVDHNEETNAVFPFGYISKAILDKETDLKEYIELGSENFVLPVSYWTTLSLGDHLVTLYGIEEVRVYRLRVADSRKPEISVGTYIKDGENLVGVITPYGNTIHDVCGFYDPLPSTQATIEGNDIIFKASYLDSLSDGDYAFNLSFTAPQQADYSYLQFKIVVTSKQAELVTDSYEYAGSDLDIKIKTNGDTITKVVADETVLSKFMYSTDKNSLIINKDFFDSGNYTTFIISTAKGASLTFKVTYIVDGYVLTSKEYDYDKSDTIDMLISGRAPTDSTVTVFGNSIVSSDYYLEKGQLKIRNSYLSSLKSGIYDYSIYVNDVITDFSINVYDSEGGISNLKLNYDISETDTFITFDCDCRDNVHTYSLDSSSFEPCIDGQSVSVSRDTSHTLKVRCKEYNKESIYAISPNSQEVGYINQHFSINGIVADKFINSFDEFVFALQYVSNGADDITVTPDAPNGKAELVCCLSESFYNYAKENSDFFDRANSLIDVAYSCSFSFSTKERIATISATYRYNPNILGDDGKKTETLRDNTAYLVKGDRAESFNDFAINNFKKTERITSLCELEALEYGVKPTFEANSLPEKAYNAALIALRTYISNNMTDTEKVITIYHYLTKTVTYDTYAYDLYMLRNNVYGQSLANQKELIRTAINNEPTFEDMLTPLLSYTDSNALFSALANSISSLASFSIYGALNNHIAVCDGIASAFKLMCLIEGIECIEVTGVGVTNAGSQNHAWNKVKLDGKWFIVDATWGRSSGYINHRYLLIDEKDASHTHIENPNSSNQSVVDVAANGNFDYYKWNVEPYTHNDMVVQSSSEFQSLVSVLKFNGELQCEIKLDYSYSSIQKEINSLKISCSYFVYDNIVLIIMER